MVNSEVEQHIAVFVMVTVGSIRPLNLDPLPSRKVTQVVDLKVFRIFPSRQI